VISHYLRSIGTSISSAWPLLVIVHGGARGADQLADQVARGRAGPRASPRRLGPPRPIRRIPTATTTAARDDRVCRGRC
jgi:hypothetical protein